MLMVGKTIMTTRLAVDLLEVVSMLDLMWWVHRFVLALFFYITLILFFSFSLCYLQGADVNFSGGLPPPPDEPPPPVPSVEGEVVVEKKKKKKKHREERGEGEEDGERRHRKKKKKHREEGEDGERRKHRHRKRLVLAPLLHRKSRYCHENKMI